MVTLAYDKYAMNTKHRAVVTRNKNMRPSKERLRQYEVFRTPAHAYQSLFDYRPEWFLGTGFDPSAGDGRMFAELIKRGFEGPFHANDIREEESDALERSGASWTIGDYLKDSDPPTADFMVTNPPFSLSVPFVEKAREHVGGPICILQAISWQSTQKRSAWMKANRPAYILNLAKRPKWEVDSGGKAPTSLWDFAWFVFLPGHDGPTVMDWLL